MEELQLYKILQPWTPRDARHSLFHSMKYPNQTFWTGSWGPEILYYDKEDNLTTGQLGRVYATDARYEKIRTWFIEAMFNHAPGND